MNKKKQWRTHHTTRHRTEEWRAKSTDACYECKKKWKKKWVAEINKKCQYRRLLTPILNVVYIERKKQHFQIASHTVSGMAIWTQKNRGETKHEHAHTDTASPQQSGLFNYYVYDRRLEVIHFLLLASRWMTQKKTRRTLTCTTYTNRNKNWTGQRKMLKTWTNLIAGKSHAFSRSWKVEKKRLWRNRIFRSERFKLISGTAFHNEVYFIRTIVMIMRTLQRTKHTYFVFYFFVFFSPRLFPCVRSSPSNRTLESTFILLFCSAIAIYFGVEFH